MRGKVTPFLNEALGEDNWEVDTSIPSKVLTVPGEEDPVEVIRAVGESRVQGGDNLISGCCILKAG